MHEICFYTLLGGSLNMMGKEITLEVMEKKPALLAAIESRKNDEVEALDNGEIPGDHLGEFPSLFNFSKGRLTNQTIWVRHHSLMYRVLSS